MVDYCPIAVVIPCYRVRAAVLDVIGRIGPEVTRIYCVDDACPEKSGDYIEAACTDPRVTVVRHGTNRGVGGAVMTGYRRAVADGMTVVVKVDGDGQMKPELIPRLVQPLLDGTADYAKGNRFYFVRDLREMPFVRLMGNAGLSFITKVSSGYWPIFDPTNGFTAIHQTALVQIMREKIADRYFFESDILFRLNVIRAVVVDVPMAAHYAGEISSLRISTVWPQFIGGNLRNLFKRFFYNYFLRDFNVASVELLVGAALLLGGCLFGGLSWWRNAQAGEPSSAGTVMLAALPVIVGLQMLLAFLNFDVQSIPRIPIQKSKGLFLDALDESGIGGIYTDRKLPPAIKADTCPMAADQ